MGAVGEVYFTKCGHGQNSWSNIIVYITDSTACKVLDGVLWTDKYMGWADLGDEVCDGGSRIAWGDKEDNDSGPPETEDRCEIGERI